MRLTAYVFMEKQEKHVDTPSYLVLSYILRSSMGAYLMSSCKLPVFVGK